MRNYKNQKRNFIWIVLLCNIFISACGQTPKDSDKSFKLVYAVDIYRKNVADSLKYLIPILDSVWESDQEYRYGTVNNPKGKVEQEKAMQRFQSHKKEVRDIDSINIIKVSSILDKYGWLGYKTIGILESDALFFVIQHADSATQEKYLPLLRKAVMGKKENPHHLTMLEDRISLKKNQYQIYGTQVIYDFQKKKYYLLPIIDPENIIERRRSIGLDSSSLQSYLNTFHIIWNVETYKKELPEAQKLMSSFGKH